MKAFPLMHPLPHSEESPSVSPRVKLRGFRVHTSIPRGRTDSRPRSIAVSPRINPRDITSFIDCSMYATDRQIPYSTHIGELNQTNAVLRHKYRFKSVTAIEADGETAVEKADALHQRFLSVLRVCHPLSIELDLLQGIFSSALLSHQRESTNPSKQDRFSQWKTLRAQQAENQSLLGRRNHHQLNRSFECSMRRPHSATKQDYYASALLGTSEQSQQFARLLTEALNDSSNPYQHFYDALDILLESRGEHCGRGSAGSIRAVSEDLRTRLATVVSDDVEVSQGEIVELMRFLSQELRFLLKDFSTPDTGTALGLMWKLAVVAVDKAFQLVGVETAKAKQALLEELKAEEARIVKTQAATVADLQSKVTKGQEDIKRLNASLDHLRAEKATLLELLRDRDDEISSLKLPPNLKDFDRLLEEMSSYLEEAEGRQVNQASMLETISVMLDTTRLKSTKKRQKKVLESPKSAVSAYPNISFRSSPMNRPSVQKSPPKLQLGEKAFFRMMTSELEGDGGFAEPLSAITLHVPEKHLSKSTNREESSSDFSDESEPSEVPRFCEEHAQTDLVGEMTQSESGIVSLASLRPPPTNPLLKELEQVAKRQPPLSESAVLRFMELVFEEKFRMDAFREEQKQEYDELSEFLVSFVYTQSGLRSAARLAISGVMNGIEKMATAGHEYGQLVCKLLGVFECGCVPLELETFLMKAQAAFTRLHPSILRFTPELGGSAPFVEVSDLISLLFKHRWESAGHVLDGCCPQNMSEVEVVCVLLCGKLGKLGRDLKYFFVQVDTEKCGTITFKAFGEGVRNVLGVALSWEKMEKLWTTFETDHLTFQQLSSLSFKEYTQKADSRHAYITRYQFLTAIIREYERLSAVETLRISAVFQAADTNGDGVMTLEEFAEMVRRIDPNASQPLVVKLFRETLGGSNSGGDALDRDVFCRVVIGEKVGGTGKFGFGLKLQNCDPMLRQIMERDYEVGSPRNLFKKKAKKAG